MWDGGPVVTVLVYGDIGTRFIASADLFLTKTRHLTAFYGLRVKNIFLEGLGYSQIAHPAQYFWTLPS